MLNEPTTWIRCAALLLATMIVLCLATSAWACPNCKEALAENDPQGQAMAAGYYYSILFMLSMPVIIITTFSSFAYRAVQRAKAEKAAAEAASLQLSADARPRSTENSGA